MRWLAAVKKANLAHLPIVAGMEPSYHLFHPAPNGGVYGTKGKALALALAPLALFHPTPNGGVYGTKGNALTSTIYLTLTLNLTIPVACAAPKGMP